MTSFSDILSTPAATVERPKPLPVGTYLCIVAGAPEHTQSKQKQTDQLEFKLNVIQPLKDVDTTALADAGGAQGKTLLHRLYVTDNAKWRIKEFIEHLGIDIGSKSLGEALAEAPGRQLAVTVAHQPSQDGKAIFANVASTARV